jgi:hypothetical protein
LRSGAHVAASDVFAAALNGHVAVLQAFIAAGVDVRAGGEAALAAASEQSTSQLPHIIAPECAHEQKQFPQPCT